MHRQAGATAIIFDLGGIQYTGVAQVEAEIRRYIDPAFRFATVARDFTVFMHGHLTEDDFWERVARGSRWTTPVAQIKQIARRGFVEIPGTRGILRALRRGGYRIGLLSNQSREWDDYFQLRFGYHERFDARVYSFQLGVSKPDPRAYQAILEQLGVEPSAAVYVDDRRELVDAAERLGMAGIQVQSADQLRADLAQLNLQLRLPAAG